MLSRSRSTLVVAVLVGSLLAAAAPAQADPAPGGVGGKLSGVVQDDRGKALAGANVALTDSSGAVVASSTVGKDGHYDLTVAPGTYTLEADSRSGGSRVRVAVPGVVVGADSTLDVVAVGRADGLVDFRGRILDSAGSPLGGTTVDLMADTRTVTDGNGQFVLGVRRGVHTLRMWSERFSVTVPDFDLTGDRVGDLTLPLVDYDVTLRDASGALLTNTPVEIYPTPTGGTEEPGLVPTPIGDASWVGSQWADSSGRIHVQGLETDKLTLDIYRRGTVTVDGRGQTSFDVTVPDPAPTPPLPSTVRLSGTLTDVDGVSPTGPSVSLLRPDGSGYGGQRAYSPGSGPGAFTIDAPPGTYQLHLSESLGELEDWEGGDPEGDRYTLSSDGFRHDGPRTIAFRLPAGPDLTVRVVDYDGVPVAGAVVTATSTAPAGSTPFEIAPGVRAAGRLTSVRVTDDDGRATLRTLPGPVSSTVEVDAPAERGFDADVNIPAGATTADVQLERGIVVSGRISQGGYPGSPGRHFYLGSDDAVYGPIDVGFDGSYRVSVRPGTFSVQTDNDDDEPGGESDDHWNSSTSSSTFKVTGDRILNLDYPAVPSSRLRFLGADGAPIEAEIGYSSSSGDEGFEIAPGITATASSWFSSFGARDQESIEVWPGGTVSGGIDPGVDIPFSGVRLTPGGDAVIVLAQGYSLVRPDPPAEISAAAGADGSAAISWDGTANGHGNSILGYQLSLYSDADAREMIVPAVTCTTVTGLAPNSRYRVNVSAMTRRGIGESSLSASFETPAMADPQAAPAPCPSPATPTGPPPLGGHPPTDTSPPGNFHPSDSSPSSGYWALGADGAVYSFGAAGHLGSSTAGAVDLEPTPSGKGYWVLNRNGHIEPFGDASKLGDVDRARLANGETPASLSATPSGKGYWIFTNRGRAIAFGDAPHLGDVSDVKLNGPVLGSVATPSGKGYYMVASDGGIFAFGDAAFAGSMGGRKLNAPVQSLVPDADGKGYWLVASDGGIFAFDAPFRGSLGGMKLNKPVVGMVRYGDGYLMVGADGGIFNFSTSPFSGSLGDEPLAAPVVAVAALP